MDALDCPAMGSIEWMAQECARVARAAQAAAARDGFGAKLYLYYRAGALCLAADFPAGDGWKPGPPGYLPSGLTCDEIATWVAERARRLPCLPPLRVCA